MPKKLNDLFGKLSKTSLVSLLTGFPSLAYSNTVSVTQFSFLAQVVQGSLQLKESYLSL